MKILFVYPNLKGQPGFNYGLGSLSAVLKAAGHETGLVNLNEKVEPPPEPAAFAERVRAFGPDLVGFSVVTPQFRTALSLARVVKESVGVPVAFGGVHATMVPEEVIAQDAVDFVFVGEAEAALLELVEGLRTGGDVSGIRNLWSKEGGRTRANPVGPLPDLAGLPMPDHDLFDFKTLTAVKNGWVGILSSRGCPYRCSYCFNHKMEERYRRELGVSARDLGYVRHRPVDQVVAEMASILDRGLDVRMFIFDDDLFTYDGDYVKAFCDRYRRIASVPLTVNAHVRRFTPDVGAALAAAGCRIVKFGIESGSPRIRSEVLNRHMSDAQIVASFEAAHGNGLATSAFVMTGLPRETPEDLGRTFDVCARARPGRLRWSTFYPFPGTRAHEMARADGSILGERLAALDGFFEESCLDLGAEMNRLVHRTRWLFPWFVNARLPDPVGSLYAARVEEWMALDDGAFAGKARSFREEDARAAAVAAARGGEPYRILYNDFMAVRPGAEGD